MTKKTAILRKAGELIEGTEIGKPNEVETVLFEVIQKMNNHIVKQREAIVKLASNQKRLHEALVSRTASAPRRVKASTRAASDTPPTRIRVRLGDKIVEAVLDKSAA